MVIVFWEFLIIIIIGIFFGIGKFNDWGDRNFFFMGVFIYIVFWEVRYFVFFLNFMVIILYRWLN